MIAQLDTEQIRTHPGRAVARVISHLLLQGRPLTTRARWLNELLLAQFEAVKRLPLKQPVRKPVYVLGTGRSGTTILGQILSLHPHVVFLNEPKALWYAVRQDEDVIGSYTRGPARYRLATEDASAEVCNAARRLYRYALMITGSQRVLDKYPEMIFRASFLQAIFPDAKFLFLVRNGWDTSRSIATWSAQYGTQVAGETHDWWGIDRRKWQYLLNDIVAEDMTLAPHYEMLSRFTQQEEMGAVEWIATMREGLRLMNATPGAVHKVSYETLTHQPRSTLRDILDFCELPKDARMLDYGERSLKPVAAKRPFPLPPALEGLFLDTMKELDYLPQTQQRER